MNTEAKILKFRKLFPDEDTCLSILANFKWEKGFVCLKCGNTNYCSGKSPLSRRCTRCKKDESVTANTAFHRCKIPLNKAFEIAFSICNSPEISSYEISRQIEVRHMTCYTFQKKMIDCQNAESRDVLLTKILNEINKQVNSAMKKKKAPIFTDALNTLL